MMSLSEFCILISLFCNGQFDSHSSAALSLSMLHYKNGFVKFQAWSHPCNFHDFEPASNETVLLSSWQYTQCMLFASSYSREECHGQRRMGDVPYSWQHNYLILLPNTNFLNVQLFNAKYIVQVTFLQCLCWQLTVILHDIRMINLANLLVGENN